MAGFMIGMALMMPGHLLGATGAGDVKLMGAIGAIVGPGMVVSAFLFTAVAGGVLAVAVATRGSGWPQRWPGRAGWSPHRRSRASRSVGGFGRAGSRTGRPSRSEACWRLWSDRHRFQDSDGLQRELF